MKRIATTAVALITGIVVLTGWSGSTEAALASTASTHAAAVTPASRGTITIHNFGFSGPRLLAPGARVTVRNLDSTAHTITANVGHAFNVRVGAHKTVTFRAPRKAGRYGFHCSIHPFMKGSLRVR